MSANPMNKITIRFSNRHEAVAVFPPENAEAKEIVMALSPLAYEAMIVVLGGADSIDGNLLPRLTQLFGRGIARAAVDARALILDGGTESGVMKLMGEGVAGRGYKTPLVGVAPKDLVTHPPDEQADRTPLDPNHSHFVLVEGNTWGSETAPFFDLAEALSQPEVASQAASKPPQKGAEKAEGKKSAVAILAGGGPVTRDEVRRAVRQNLSLIVIEGSGGLADEIAAAWKARPALPDDPVMAEIIDDGEIHLHLLSNPVKGIERLIIRELGVDRVLMQAWEVFADYDLSANKQQQRFKWLQLGMLILGVIGTGLAIVQQVYAPRDTAGNLLPASLITNAAGRWETTVPFGWWLLRQTLIIVPILLTVLVAAANRFKQGSKWLLLRAGAESIKREIYRYRTRAMDYKQEPEQQLSQKVEDITRRTMRTEVNLSALVPYNKERGFPPDMYAAQSGDDGFSYLTPDRYVEVRLGDQLNYFQKRCRKLEWQLKTLYWLTFLVGGVGTYLAAVNQQAWIALTTAVVAAIGTYLGYMQVENSLTKYNQAATDLANVKAWWNALSADKQSLQENIDSLVAHTEQVLQSELDGWVQQMQNALAELRKEPKQEKEEKGEPHEPPPNQQPGNPGGAAPAPPNQKPGPENQPGAPAGGQPPPGAPAGGGQQPAGGK